MKVEGFGKQIKRDQKCHSKPWSWFRRQFFTIHISFSLQKLIF